MNETNILIPTIKTKEEIKSLVDNIKKNSVLPINIITSCVKTDAAKNRNICLDESDKYESEFIIMLDDDITGFYPGWDKDLINPLLQYNNVIIVSARLLNKNRGKIHMMGNTYDYVSPLTPTKGNIVCSACIAFKTETFKNLRYDENFKGSGFEDSDIMLRLNDLYPGMRVTINNNCKLIHINEMKNQKGSNWTHNESYFLNKWKHKPKWYIYHDISSPL